MISVLIVDDHPIVRAGLAAVLEDQPDFRVVGAAGTAAEARALVPRLRPDAALLDLELPDEDGSSVLPRLLEGCPALQVVVFTAYATDERVLGALRAGAAGYILKGAPSEEIVRALRTVAAGGSYLEPRVAARIVAHVAAPARGPSPGLSAREREVLKWVAAGLSNKQIAHVLAITERTVKFHVRSVFNKLGADSRAHAVSLALGQNLL